MTVTTTSRAVPAARPPFSRPPLPRPALPGPPHGMCPSAAPPGEEAATGPGAGPVLVAVAHGSRDPRARRATAALLARVRALRPGLRVAPAHIELTWPPLEGTLRRIADAGQQAVLVPLLFGRGHHVKQDLPRAVASALPGARIAPPLGAHSLLVEALACRLAEAGWAPPATGRAGLVLAAAGSRDPESQADTARLAAGLSARLGGLPVLPAYASARPGVTEAVRELRASGRTTVGLASCFAAPGRFAAECAAAVPPGTVTAAPLGAHPALARLVLRRYDDARPDGAGTAPDDRTGAPAREPFPGG